VLVRLPVVVYRPMSQNPEDWRSAVDPSSGRTYWYHRKTRESTWVRPDFAEVAEVAKPAPARTNSQETRPATADPRSQPSRSLFGKKLEAIARDLNSTSQAQLNNLLSELQQSHTLVSTDASYNISALVRVVIQSCGERCNSNAINARRTALKCLWWLSNVNERRYAGTHFYSEQSWTSLFQYASNWKTASGNSPQGDAESLLLLGALASNLMVGPSALLISTDLANSFAHSIESLPSGDAATAAGVSSALDSLLSAQAGCSAVLCDRTVQTLALLAQKGHRLPAAWLVTVFTHALR
jgi:hypothetical protein